MVKYSFSSSNAAQLDVRLHIFRLTFNTHYLISPTATITFKLLTTVAVTRLHVQPQHKFNVAGLKLGHYRIS